MTINEVASFENTPDEIKRLARERGVPGEPTEAALNAVVAFFDVNERDREWILSTIRNLVCQKCGKASCLHGYSDC